MDNFVINIIVTTWVISLLCVHIMSLTKSESAIWFLIEIMFIWKAFKSHLKSHMLTLKAPITTAVDDIHKYFFFLLFFRENKT